MASDKKHKTPDNVIPLFGAQQSSLASEFGNWLAATEFEWNPVMARALVESVLDALSREFADFEPTAWSPRDAHSVLITADTIQTDEPDVAVAMVSVSCCFLRFLEKTERWGGTHQDLALCIGDLQGALDGEPASPVSPADIVLAAVPPEQEIAALAELRPTQRLRALVTWIGKGKQVTATGAPRPALIQSLAVAVGIELSEGHKTVRSLRNIPTLAALWDAATASGLVELTSTRAFRGPMAYEFERGHPNSLVATREAVTHLVRSNFEVDDALDPFQDVKVVATQLVLSAMTNNPPVKSPLNPRDATDSSHEAAAQSILEHLLHQFETDGWLIGDRTYTVPEPLRPAVLAAIESLDLYDETTVL